MKNLACGVPPCIYTRATGKHEWNIMHSKHQSNAEFWIPICPACGWIDLKKIINDIPFWTRLKYALMGYK